MSSLLLIARSTRALAVSAKACGYRIHTIDCFCDEDTAEMAVTSQKINYQENGFNAPALLEKVSELLTQYPGLVIVTGSGFESTPNLITQLERLAPVYSNSGAIIKQLNSPEIFSEIPSLSNTHFPDFSLSVPTDPEGWLVKRIGGEGGEHVRWLAATKESANQKEYYYQKYVPGRVMSAVFITAADTVQLVGCNYQLQTQQFTDLPFLHCGAVSLNSPEAKLADKLQCYLEKVIAESPLRGLCGVDFILTEDNELCVLEINPRPPASYPLHEQHGELFLAHVNCFEKNTIQPTSQDKQSKSQGYYIVYARQKLTIGRNIDWPEWVSDKPVSDTVVQSKSPICTVHAKAESPGLVEKWLARRVNQIESIILNMQNAA